MKLFSFLDPGLAEDVEDVSMCSPDKHLQKRKASSPPVPPIVSKHSPEDSSKPAPKKRLLSQNILVLDEIESNREIAASAGLMGEIGTDSHFRASTSGL